MNENKNLCRIKYDKKTDSYCLMLSTDEGETWDFSMSAECRRWEGDKKEAEPEYIHISIIEELKRAVWCGFKFVY